MTVARSILRGVEASAVGTLAMDTLLYRRYRNNGGGETFAAWEFSDGIQSWEEAPAPALVGKQFVERLTGHDISSRCARALNNMMHWAFGLAAGRGYGLLAGVRTARLQWGLPFGAAVWADGYVVLPRLGVYEEIWSYDRNTLAKDLSAHLVFGAATAAAFLLLGRSGRRPTSSPVPTTEGDHHDSTTDDAKATANRRVVKADLKLEAVAIPVSDPDRPKAFYERLGWRLDADFAFANGFRVVQFTPPGSGASVQFGTKITAAPAGSAQGLYLVVSDIEAARNELADLGVDVSEVFHAGTPGAQFADHADGRVLGAAPEHESYGSFATFRDPDGNEWLLQEVRARVPGRVDAASTRFASRRTRRRDAPPRSPTVSTSSATAASTTSTGPTGTRPTSSPSRPARSSRHDHVPQRIHQATVSVYRRPAHPLTPTRAERTTPRCC